MQICPRRDIFAGDLEQGGGLENPLEFLEIGQTRRLGRLGAAQQGPERPAVNGATGGVIPQRKDQRLNVSAPACLPGQVETARQDASESSNVWRMSRPGTTFMKPCENRRGHRS